jgi:hypothetical protein
MRKTCLVSPRFYFFPLNLTNTVKQSRPFLCLRPTKTNRLPHPPPLRLQITE